MNKVKKLNTFLNILMGSFFGVFIGCTISNYRDYRANPEIYMVNSAPWYYFGALQGLILFLVIVIICVITKLLIKHRKNGG